MAEDNATATAVKEADDAEDAKGDKSATETAVSLVTSVVETTPMKALLTPAFTHLGSYMGERAAAWVDGLRERRERNLASHIEAVAKAQPGFNPDKVTERQARLAIEWAQEAQSVDPEAEKELAAMWRGLLASINENDHDANEMISVMKSISPRQARYIISFNNGWQQPDFHMHDIDRLFSLGIFRRFRVSDLFLSRVFRQIMLCLLMLSFVLVTANIALTLRGELLPVTEKVAIMRRIFDGISFPSIFVTGISFAFLLVWISTIFFKVRLTRLGIKLRNTGRKYYRT